MASQRAALLGKLFTAQNALERVIAELARSGANTAFVDAQLGQLARLQASIGLADASTLQHLTGQIGAAIAQARSIEQQAQDQIASASLTEREQLLAGAASETRSALASAMETLRHIPLRFSSAEDEREYRDREAERQAYIAAQQAKHTPQGDFNAAAGGIGQMVDAKEHGASGPEFEQKWKELVASTEKLRAQAKANGLSTEEFDQRLRDDLRRIMKAKGYNDAQIDAQLASNRDPLEAAKSILSGTDDLSALQRSTERVETSSKLDGRAPLNEVASVAAALQSAGVTTHAHEPAASPEHGVSLSQIAAGIRTL